MQNLDDKINLLEAEILLYDDRISALKSEYAQMVERAYMSRHSHDAMLYLFSAENFTEAYKRFQLMQNYSRVRKEQTENISRSQEEKAIAKEQLEEEKQEKEGLMGVQAEERAQLAADKKKQQKALASLEQKQEKLKEQQQEQEAERRKLNKKIEEIISAELAVERKKNDGKFEMRGWILKKASSTTLGMANWQRRYMYLQNDKLFPQVLQEGAVTAGKATAALLRDMSHRKRPSPLHRPMPPQPPVSLWGECFRREAL